jgi:hypothetical protein
MIEQYASAFSWTALANIQQEYPNKLDHVMNDAADLQSPRALHPLFYQAVEKRSARSEFWSRSAVVRIVRRAPQAKNRRDRRRPAQ